MIDTQYTQELRDYIATAALQVILKQSSQLKYAYGGCSNVLEDECKLAYKIADNMLSARYKSQKQFEAK